MTQLAFRTRSTARRSPRPRTRLRLERFEDRLCPSDLLVANYGNSLIQRYEWETGRFLGTFASGGSLAGPLAMDFGPDGNLYVASYNSSNVKRYHGKTGSFIDTFASGGGLSSPRGLTFGPDGHLYVTSSTNVLRYNGQTGAFMGAFTTGGNLNNPTDMLFGPDGHLYVNSWANNQVNRFDGTTGAFIGNFASGGALDGPWGLTFGPDGHLYVGSSRSNHVKRYDGTTGAFIDNFATGGGMNYPTGVNFGEDGHLYVGSRLTNSVKRYHGGTGTYLGDFTTGGVNDSYLQKFFTTGGAVGPVVISQTPRRGPDSVATVRLTFDRAIDVKSFTTDDVTALTTPGGPVPIKKVAVVPDSGDTQFDISFAEQGRMGSYRMTVGPDILDTKGNPMDQYRDGVPGQPNDAYAATFAIEGPRVVRSSPTGSVGAPVDVFRVVFNRPMDAATFTPQDVVSFTGPGGSITVTKVTPVKDTNDTEFDLSFAPQERTGGYSLTLGPDVRDTFNTQMDQNNNLIAGEVPADRFTGNFRVVNPCFARTPAGYYSCVYPHENFSIVNQPGSFTIINTAEDAFAPVNLGNHTFEFYGTRYTGANALFVSSNGLITFGAGRPDAGNTNLTNYPPEASLAVLWDDWSKTSGSQMVVGLMDEANGRLVIEWNQVRSHWVECDDKDCYDFYSPRAVSFQAILYLDTGGGDFVVYNYLDLDSGNFAAQGASATAGMKAAGPQGPERLVMSMDNGNRDYVGTNQALLVKNIIAGPTLIASTPTGTLLPPVRSVRVTFDRVIDAKTFTPDDVTLIGPNDVPVPVTNVVAVPGGGDRLFDVTFADQGATGTYRLVIGPDVRDAYGNPMDQDRDGIAGEKTDDQYRSSFRLSGSRVTGHAPTGGVPAPVDHVQVTFNRPMDPKTFTLKDVVRFFGPAGDIKIKSITPVEGSNNTRFEITFAPQDRLGGYVMVLGPDILDTYGNALDQNGNLIPGEVPTDEYVARFVVTSNADCGGFDAFGHLTCFGTYEKLDLEPGQPGVFTIINSCHDCFASVNLGKNTFRFYGTTYTGAGVLYVSSNGLLTFDGANFQPINSDLTSSPSLRTLAVLWDDWVDEDDMVLGLFDGDRLIIEWNDVRHASGGTSGVTFQVILHLNTGDLAGAVTYNFVDLDAGNPNVDGGRSATVGLKDRGLQGENRILVSFNGLSPFVGDGQALATTGPGRRPLGAGGGLDDLMLAELARKPQTLPLPTVPDRDERLPVAALEQLFRGPGADLWPTERAVEREFAGFMEPPWDELAVPILG